MFVLLLSFVMYEIFNFLVLNDARIDVVAEAQIDLYFAHFDLI
jgi:hypothetical protein